jgi:outer membrane protein
MEITHRQTIFNTEQSFNNVTAGISKVSADRIAVISAKSALESIQAGYRVGTKTILDVLLAEQTLYQTQATLSTDQYDYVLDTLALKQAAGSLNATDVITVNNLWLLHE